MNYDLFIPPQTLERVAVIPLGTSPGEGAIGGRKSSHTSGGGDPADKFVEPAVHEEVSSDERTTDKVQEAVELVNLMLDRSPVDLNLSIDEDTKSVVIKLIERESHKVIRQIPPDEILRLRRHLQELLGVIFDKRA